MKYYVDLREVHTHRVVVEADSPDKALDVAQEGNYEEMDPLLTEYSHTLERDTWTVEPDVRTCKFCDGEGEVVCIDCAKRLRSLCVSFAEARRLMSQIPNLETLERIERKRNKAKS